MTDNREDLTMHYLYVPEGQRAEIASWRAEPDASDGADLLMELLVANDSRDPARLEELAIRYVKRSEYIHRQMEKTEIDTEAWFDLIDAEREIGDAAIDLLRDVFPAAAPPTPSESESE